MKHPLIPGVDVRTVRLHPIHHAFAKKWRESAIVKADSGDVAASVCLQSSIIELATEGRLIHDWLGVMDEYLSVGGSPIAYSLTFANRLYHFDGQYLQSTIAAIHTRWWIECAANGYSTVDHHRFANLVLRKLDPASGLIFDRDVSETTLRHRMKTELTLSMALSAEILRAAAALPPPLSDTLAASIADPKKCPPTQYMSTEYFRLSALTTLGFPQLFPAGIQGAIDACGTDLAVGYCDFPMTSKVDAYMGTAKRTARDRPIHSPLTAHHVTALVPQVADDLARKKILDCLRDYAIHLRANPEDVPAFQMRDIPAQFGDGMTPIEAVCASHLIGQC